MTMVCINPCLPVKNTPRNSMTILNMEMAGWTKKIRVSTCAIGWFQNHLFVPHSNKSNQELTICHWLTTSFIYLFRHCVHLFVYHYFVFTHSYLTHLCYEMDSWSYDLRPLRLRRPRFSLLTLLYVSVYCCFIVHISLFISLCKKSI